MLSPNLSYSLFSFFFWRHLTLCLPSSCPKSIVPYSYFQVGLCDGGLVAKSRPSLLDLMDCLLPGSSCDFPGQEYWSELPFPSPGHLPTHGLNMDLLHCRQILHKLSHQGSPQVGLKTFCIMKYPCLTPYLLLAIVISLYPSNGALQVMTEEVNQMCPLWK